MRGADDVLTTEERRIGARLFRIDVESDAAEFSGIEAALERFHIVDSAARAVDKANAVFHRLDFFIADKVARRVGQRSVNSEIIDEGEKFGDGIVNLDVEFLSALRGEVGVEGDDLHIEGFRELRDCLSDASHTDDTERLAAELTSDELFTIPTSFGERLVRGAGVAAQREHESKGLLSGRNGVAAGSVHDDDPATGSGLEVDIVDADARASDRLEAFVSFKSFGGNLHAATTDGAVEFGKGLAQLFAFKASADLVFESGVLH